MPAHSGLPPPGSGAPPDAGNVGAAYSGGLGEQEAVYQTQALTANNPMSAFRAFDFADLLVGDKTGQDLAEALRVHFSDITRPDVFTGVRVAKATWVADLLEAQAERDALRGERDAARLDADAAQIELGYLRAQIRTMSGEGSWLWPAKVLGSAA